MILSVLASIAVLAAIAVIAAALVFAETTLVFIALGLAGASALLLVGALIQGRATAARTDGLGKSSVPAAVHTVPEYSGRVPAPAPEPVREFRDRAEEDSGSGEPEYDLPRWQTPTAGDRPEPHTVAPDPAPFAPVAVEHGSRAEETPEPEDSHPSFHPPEDGPDRTFASPGAQAPVGAAEPEDEGTAPSWFDRTESPSTESTVEPVCDDARSQDTGATAQVPPVAETVLSRSDRAEDTQAQGGDGVAAENDEDGGPAADRADEDAAVHSDDETAPGSGVPAEPEAGETVDEAPDPDRPETAGGEDGAAHPVRVGATEDTEAPEPPVPAREEADADVPATAEPRPAADPATEEIAVPAVGSGAKESVPGSGGTGGGDTVSGTEGAGAEGAGESGPAADGDDGDGERGAEPFAYTIPERAEDPGATAAPSRPEPEDPRDPDATDTFTRD